MHTFKHTGNLKELCGWTSLEVQWLRLCASDGRGCEFDPWSGS